MDIVPQLIANSIIAGSIYSLVALGFNLIYDTTKFFNLAHGAVAVAGGYVVLFLTTTAGLGLILGVLLGILIAGLLGYALDKIIYLPLRRRRATEMVLLVASLGAFTVLQAIIAIFFTSQFQTLTRDFNGASYQIGGAIMTHIQVIIFISGIVIMGGLALMLRTTLFGKAVRAVSDDEEVAKIVGIDTDKIISRVFFIGSAIAGLAGILIGFDTGLEPTMGMSLLLKGVIGSIIGGVGNIYGGVLGSFLLGFAENFGIWKISGEWKDAIAFAVLIIFLFVRPQGIFKK